MSSQKEVYAIRFGDDWRLAIPLPKTAYSLSDNFPNMVWGEYRTTALIAGIGEEDEVVPLSRAGDPEPQRPFIHDIEGAENEH